MRLEQNTISRDWTVTHEGRRFFVDFACRDAPIPGVYDREKWRVREETDEGIEEFGACVSNGSSPEEWAKAQEHAGMIEKLIEFCLGYWEDEVSRETTEHLEEQKRLREGLHSEQETAPAR